jgi:hypothetical protein
MPFGEWVERSWEKKPPPHPSPEEEGEYSLPLTPPKGKGNLFDSNSKIQYLKGTNDDIT